MYSVGHLKKISYGFRRSNSFLLFFKENRRNNIKIPIRFSRFNCVNTFTSFHFKKIYKYHAQQTSHRPHSMNSRLRFFFRHLLTQPVDTRYMLVCPSLNANHFEPVWFSSRKIISRWLVVGRWSAVFNSFVNVPTNATRLENCYKSITQL